MPYRTITVAPCTQDCSYYRLAPGLPAAPHIHVPTFGLAGNVGTDPVAIRVPAEHLTPDGAWDLDHMRSAYPWYFDGGERGPLATIVTG